MSPILLAQADTTDPLLDDDSIAAPFSLYDEADIIIPERDTISTYVVQSGDTISEIADRFGVSVNTIRWANDIAPKGSIKVGQRLVILPVTGIQVQVKKGDTLATIAKRYKGDADDIASFNGLESGESLKVGEKIIVPDGEMNIPTTKITKSASETKSTPTPSGSPSASGYYINPVPNGILTQGYHDRYHAIDISLPRSQSMGAPIIASASGTVIVAKNSGWNGGYGSMIIIQHDNGTQTLYAHLSRVDVTVGQQVDQGQRIGGMGSTGRSTGPHLHFELRGGKTPMFHYSRR